MKVRISEQKKNEIWGTILLTLAILILISLLGDYAGPVGCHLAKFLYFILGLGAYFIPLFIGFWGLNNFRHRRLENLGLKSIGVILFLGAFCSFVSLQGEKKGGILGEKIFFLLTKSFGEIGTFVILIVLFFLSLLLSTEFLFLPFLQKIQKFRKQKRQPLSKEEIIPREVGPSEQEGEEIVAKSEEYSLPPLTLLDKPAAYTKESKEEIENTGRLLEKTLEDFEVQAKIVQISSGPVLTQYEIQPAAGVKVSRIVALSNDLALALAVPSIRIEAPIPGKAAVGIEIPNKRSNFVYLREVLSSPEFTKNNSKLVFGLGKDIAGNTIMVDLKEMPHLLIAGATGSGKSVCVNSLITSILFKAEPSAVKFLMVDPKRIELKAFSELPHLIIPIITEPRKATLALKWLVREMEERYKKFAQEGVRDIEKYNSEINNLENGDQKAIMPYIVMIIDELADLMMVSPQDCESALTRLAQMARGVGIHLVLVTQRPSVDVITGLIKSNFPSRISFEVSSKVDSRTVLDMNGAEKLLGKGDMLFSPAGTTKPLRGQCSFISHQEIERVSAYIKRQRGPHYKDERGIYEVKKEEDFAKEELDELFSEAVKLAIEKGEISVSLLQRRFRMGYNRAARLIDMLEQENIIGPRPFGNKPRKVLVGEEYLDEFKR